MIEEGRGLWSVLWKLCFFGRGGGGGLKQQLYRYGTK